MKNANRLIALLGSCLLLMLVILLFTTPASARPSTSASGGQVGGAGDNARKVQAVVTSAPQGSIDGAPAAPADCVPGAIPVSNMACGVLTSAGTRYIYCVGGNYGPDGYHTSRVIRYDPITDVLTIVTGDDWPANSAGLEVPGGAAVFNNKLYILGGLSGVAGSYFARSWIWQYDPNAAGAHWTQKSATLPVALAYVPATTIGSYIYTAGGDTIPSGSLLDSNYSYRYDPVADTITTIASIPRATGETKAITVGGEMWVPGGGRISPNPSAEVDIYNPGSNSWRLGPAFGTARRNLAADTDGSRIWAVGGIDGSTNVLSVLERYAGSWQSGASFSPGVIYRAVGLYFPTNGKFYVMGGRSADASASEYTRPVEYNPASDTWTVKGATYPPVQCPAPAITVRDASNGNALVPGAQVFRNGSYMGTTDTNGQLSIPLSQGDHLAARNLVYTGATDKGSHDGWLYHVWRTSVVQNSDGTQTITIVNDPNVPATLYLDKNNSQIGFNIVASVEYNATTANLDDIRHGFANASRRLFDSTDGQMYFENLNLYDAKQAWADADVQFFTGNLRPNSDLGGRTGMASTTAHMNLPGRGWDGQGWDAPWSQPSGYGTIVHELGHYALGACDEYVDNVPPLCTLDRNSQPQEKRASIMADSYDSTEYCATNVNVHNADSRNLQGNEPVWSTILRNWNWNTELWTLQSPDNRGTVDPGPFTLSDLNTMTFTQHHNAGNTCTPVKVHVTWAGLPINAVMITLVHNGVGIEEGTTRMGDLRVYDAAPGDTIYATSLTELFGHQWLRTGSGTVDSCGDVNIDLSTFNAPTYVLTSNWSFSQGRLHFSLRFQSDPPSTPILYATQNGGGRQSVSLVFDPQLHEYSGYATTDPALGDSYVVEVQVRDQQQHLNWVANRVSINRFFTHSPCGNPSAAGGDGATTTPGTWDVFPPESDLGLLVSASSLPDGTGVSANGTLAPPAPPQGLLVVGQPYSVEGENPLNGTAQLTLNYSAGYYCGVSAGSIAVYRYNGTGWDALPTTLNEEMGKAYAEINQWGVYAVFAQTNATPSFSDVPSGSPFYDYIQWMACAGIVSGYGDGTFRVGSNATRGQISKMIVLAFHWNIEPPASNTFADVVVGNPFYSYAETAYQMGILNGYNCGGPGEPCDGQNRPYFRPNANATRGQIAKMLANASQFGETPISQTFSDVPNDSPFYLYVERMASRGIINGYTCGGPGEPCDGENRPYFRPNANVTRGQLSKMIDLSVHYH